MFIKNKLIGLFISVIDDENSTVYTAGAIVTVTVTLTRKDMSHLFGDDTVKEKTVFEEPKVEVDEEKDEIEEQKPAAAKRPAWMKQRKVQKKSHSKKGSNKKAVPKSATVQSPNEKENDVSSHQNSASPKPKKEKKDTMKEEKEINKDKING